LTSRAKIKMTSLTKKRRKQLKKRIRHANGFPGGSDKMMTSEDVKTKLIEEVFLNEDLSENLSENLSDTDFNF
jgi:hypothetical protein